VRPLQSTLHTMTWGSFVSCIETKDQLDWALCSLSVACFQFSGLVGDWCNSKHAVIIFPGVF